MFQVVLLKEVQYLWSKSQLKVGRYALSAYHLLHYFMCSTYHMYLMCSNSDSKNMIFKIGWGRDESTIY